MDTYCKLGFVNSNLNIALFASKCVYVAFTMPKVLEELGFF